MPVAQSTVDDVVALSIPGVTRRFFGERVPCMVSDGRVRVAGPDVPYRVG
jgi:hypothetical protein